MIKGWGSWIRPHDARGRESRTLAIVGLSWLGVSARFTLDSLAPLFGLLPCSGSMTATEYAAVTAVLLGAWLGREWVDAKRGNNV